MTRPRKCKACGSQRIQVACWVRINEDEIVDIVDDQDPDNVWCEACKDHSPADYRDYGDELESREIARDFAKKGL